MGDRVELRGLTTRKDLNGVTGRVLAFDKGLYTVQLIVCGLLATGCNVHSEQAACVARGGASIVSMPAGVESCPTGDDPNMSLSRL